MCEGLKEALKEGGSGGNERGWDHCEDQSLDIILAEMGSHWKIKASEPCD